MSSHQMPVIPAGVQLLRPLITSNGRACRALCTGQARPRAISPEHAPTTPAPAPGLPLRSSCQSAEPSPGRRRNTASFPRTAPPRPRSAPVPSGPGPGCASPPRILGLGPAAGPTIPGSPCLQRGSARTSAGAHPGRAHRRDVGGACARRRGRVPDAGGVAQAQRGWGLRSAWPRLLWRRGARRDVGRGLRGLGRMGGAWVRRAAPSSCSARSDPGGWRGVGEAG